MHAMHHFSRKHVTATATCTEPPGRTATRKHRHALCSPLFQVPSAAFECICSLRSRKKNIFTDLHCTAPKFLCVYIYIHAVYSLQVNCSKLILNITSWAAPFILQCLHIWMSAATRKTSTTFASHHSDVSCKHADTNRKRKNHGQRLIMDIHGQTILQDSNSSALCQLDTFNLPVANLRDS